MNELTNQIALQFGGVAPDLMSDPNELGIKVKRKMRLALFSELEIHHALRFSPKGELGMSASYDNAPFANLMTCLMRRGGSDLRPAATFEMNDCEYPRYRDNSAARPRLALSHCENVVMHELSKKERLPSTKRGTNLEDDSQMENNMFDIRRQRLAKWMADRTLSQVDIATRTGKTRSYISLILSAGKSLGEKTARSLEKSLHMPALWLDGEVQEPKVQGFSELANLLAQTFDSLDLDAAAKQSAFVAASQTLITFAARKRLQASSALALAESQATLSNEAPSQPLLGSSRRPSEKNRLGQ